MAGGKEPLDASLKRIGITPEYVGGYRVTDEQTLRVATEVAGYSRPLSRTCCTLNPPSDDASSCL